jgi:hypothetical protein
MRGRWAAGIVPRNFTWIIEERLAVSERPGGYAPHHRKVRRQEEIIWLIAQHFDRVVSLLPSTHNLHAYEERSLASAHFPLPASGDVAPVLGELYPALLGWLRAGERLLVHQEELGERVGGVLAGFLCWSGALADPPRSISVVEQILRRQLGAAGRSIVAASIELPPPSPGPVVLDEPAPARQPVAQEEGDQTSSDQTTSNQRTGDQGNGGPGRDASGADASGEASQAVPGLTVIDGGDPAAHPAPPRRRR